MLKVETALSPRPVEEYLDAFEGARRGSGFVDLSDYLPAGDDACYAEVLVELIRLDLEYGWQKAAARPVSDYVQRFPELRGLPDALGQLAFEEYRQRVEAGQFPRVEEYSAKYGVSTSDWPRPAAASRALVGLAANESAVDEQPARTVVAPVQRSGHVTRQDRAENESDAEFDVDALAAPRVGDEIAGFRLVRELGQGAFGRVFLAQQPELANRFVVLKVSTDSAGEAQFLARLQHTNIVPIYSVHRSPSLHVTCMPYLGATTLADVLLRLSGRHALPTSGRELITTLLDRASTVTDAPPVPGAVDRAVREVPEAPAASPPLLGSTVILEKLNSLSYVEAVLWVAARLADGLAHAHERGILHRDLKPANVLMTDEGQPMLLDFNLAADTRLRNSPPGLLVGGTLPYMPPEQLLAYQSRRNFRDPRADLYSLGVILYELLTGRHPYPTRMDGPMPALMVRMVSERLKRPPGLRLHNQAVSPAVESIVRHCLEPNPEKRYQTARALQEDIQRHLEHQPLLHAPEPSLKERIQKWARRHPRLSSTASIGVAAAIVVLGLTLSLVFVNRRAERLEAVEALGTFRRDASEARFHLNHVKDSDSRATGIKLGEEVLARYQVLENVDWQTQTSVRRLPKLEQNRLNQETGDLLLLLAGAHQPAATAAKGKEDESRLLALVHNEHAEKCFSTDSAPRALWLQRADLLEGLGRLIEAHAARQRAESLSAQSARDCYLEAKKLFDAGKFREALTLARRGTELDPQDFWSWHLRGMCFSELGNSSAAIASYDVCVALRPQFPWTFRNRGKTYADLGNSQAALADFQCVVEGKPHDPGAYFDRAVALHNLGKHQEALQDLDRAVSLGCGWTRVYFFRSRIKAKLGDKDGARRDQAEGMRLEPTDDLSWNARGFARLATDAKGALADFEKALALNPRSLAGLMNKAHVHGELLHSDEQAVAALNQALTLYPDHAPARVSRGVHLARLGQREAALRDAQEALLLRAEPATFYQVADIYALTSRTTPDDALKALEMLSRALRGGFGLDILDGDPDLDPIRNRADFKRLVASVRGLRPGP